MANPATPFTNPPTKGMYPKISVIGEKKSSIPKTMRQYARILTMVVNFFDSEKASWKRFSLVTISSCTMSISSRGTSRCFQALIQKQQPMSTSFDPSLVPSNSAISYGLNVPLLSSTSDYPMREMGPMGHNEYLILRVPDSSSFAVLFPSYAYGDT